MFSDIYFIVEIIFFLVKMIFFYSCELNISDFFMEILLFYHLQINNMMSSNLYLL